MPFLRQSWHLEHILKADSLDPILNTVPKSENLQSYSKVVAKFLTEN